MNKKSRIILVIIVLFVILTGITGIYMYLTRPSLSAKKLVIYTGYDKKIYLKGRYEVDEWISDNESVAVVDNGIIKALIPGNTKITAYADNKKFVCEVEVRQSMSPYFYQIATEEKEWLFAQQLEDGAFCNRIEDNSIVSINPYFSSLGIWCVLQCKVSNDELEKIRKYIIWHFEHINCEEDYNGLKGTIYDYKAVIENGRIVDEYADKYYDSTDSYAAVFLSALWKYYEKSGDSEIIIDNKEKIELIKDAMLATLSDCYTYCKPDYKIIYLMDNAEVYEGLRSLEKIYKNIFNVEETINNIRNLKNDFIKNFNKEWKGENHYRPYIDDKHRANDELFNWDNFYPDAVSQLAPIIYNIADKEDAIKIYEQFCNAWKWEEMDYYFKSDTQFYWGMVMYGAVKMKDYNRAEEYLKIYMDETKLKDYPLIFSDCAWVVLGADKLGDYYKNIEMNS